MRRSFRVFRFGPSAILLLGGCMEPINKPKASLYTKDTESNIISVSKFVSDSPWLSFDGQGSNKPNGIAMAVYLEGAGQAKGVFGSGKIVVDMFRIDHDALGKEIPTQVQEWEFNPEQAYPWRAKKQTLLGWGYGLRLRWQQDIDLAGKQVSVVVKYVREDGRVISSSPTRSLRVPADATAAQPMVHQTPQNARRPIVRQLGPMQPKRTTTAAAKQPQKGA